MSGEHFHDGECHVVLAPFTGVASCHAERVGVGEYCAVMREYYRAVAAVGKCAGDGLVYGVGLAGEFGGKHESGVDGRVRAIGCDVDKSFGRGSASSGKSDVVSGGSVASCDDSAVRTSGVGESVDANDARVSSNYRGDVGSVVSGVCFKRCAHVENSLEGQVEAGVFAGGLSSGPERGKHWAENKRKREKKKLMKQSWRGPRVGSDGGCVSSDSEVGSVRTVDTRTGVEIEAAQTLAARRVAENRVAVKLAELKLRRLGDEGRTAVVERLAAATFEKRINEARSKAQKSFDGSEDSLKSLGSMGSAGELYARQAIKKSRDDAKTLKYVQSQAELLLRYVTPEVRQMVTDMPRPEYEDEFDVFGDCPVSFDEGDREAYYDRLAARNAELSLLSQ